MEISTSSIGGNGPVDAVDGAGGDRPMPVPAAQGLAGWRKAAWMVDPAMVLDPGRHWREASGMGGVLLGGHYLSQVYVAGGGEAQGWQHVGENGRHRRTTRRDGDGNPSAVAHLPFFSLCRILGEGRRGWRFVLD